jgi:hypothetical protein
MMVEVKCNRTLKLYLLPATCPFPKKKRKLPLFGRSFPYSHPWIILGALDLKISLSFSTDFG